MTSSARDFRGLASLVARALALYAIGGGCITLIGWFANMPRLTDWDGDGIAMFGNTAIMTIGAGLALALRTRRAPRSAWPVIVPAIFVALLGAATLLQHAARVDLGIDNLVVTHTWGTLAAVAPGRPGPPASLSFMLLGAAFILSTRGTLGGRAASLMSLVVATIAMLSLIGFLFHADQLFAVARFTGISMQTATMILALAVGLLAALPEHQPMRALCDHTGAGLIARCALPGVIALPIILGWSLIRGQQAHLYDDKLGIALLVTALILMLCGLLWWCISMVAEREQSLRLNEGSLRQEIAEREAMGKVLARRVHEQAALYRFVDRLHRSSSQQEVLDAALDCIFDALHCDRASILLFDNAGVMQFVRWRGLSEGYRAAASGHSPWKPNDADAAPISIDDIETSDLPEPLKSVVKAEGIRALGYIPLVTTGRLSGKFMTYYDAPHAFTAEELEFAVTIARQLGFGVERKLAEDAVRTSEAMLRSITDHSLDLIFVKDRESRTIFINPAGVRMSGLPQERIVGRNDAEIYPEFAEQAALFMAADQRVMESGQPESIEEEARTATGQVYTLLTTKTPRLDADGNVIGIIGIARDVTERKRTEECLRDAAQRAEAASRAKDSFLAALSHELRTPLTPVLMAVTTLERDPALSQESREHLAMMRRNILMEARLIDDLLDLTRVTHGKLQIKPTVIEIHELVRHAQDTIHGDLQLKFIELTLQLEAGESHVLGDAARLQQVFWNLLKNAIKFTPPDGTVKVRTFNPAPGRVAVAVEDTGIGISPEALSGIFEPFDQGGLEGLHQFGGLGLGLSISKAIVDRHGGELRAMSDGSGTGAAFVVELDTVDAPVNSSLVDFAAPAPLGSLRLLVVEDHEPTLAAVCLLLQRDGHSVFRASTVTDALAQAAQNECDLVISDLGLPDGTGFQLMSEIRRCYAWPGIALSGYGMEEDLRMSAESGFAAHLVKPLDFAGLRAAISKIMDEAHKARRGAVETERRDEQLIAL